jgi:hypothetical protein
MEMSGQLHAQAALFPGKEAPVPNVLGGSLGPRVRLDAVMNRKKFPARSLVIVLTELLPLQAGHITENVHVLSMLRVRVSVTTAWRVIWVWMEEMASKYGG